VEGSREAYARHLNEQLAIYGRNILVNLINHTGSEGKMEQAFRQMVGYFHRPVFDVPITFTRVCDDDVDDVGWMGDRWSRLRCRRRVSCRLTSTRSAKA
jgi:hypothetical protein